MDVAYSEEQAFLREAVRGAVDREAPLARVREWVLEGGTVRTAALAEQQGWCGIGIDEDAGGQGGGLMELAILAEELGRGAVPADNLYATLLAARLLAASGEDVSELVAGGPAACVLMEADRPGAPGGDLVLGAPGATHFVSADAVVHTDAEVSEVRIVDPTRSLGRVSGCKRGSRDEFCTGLAADAAVMIAADALGASQR
ncbi:MAG: hypothetical protein QOF76_4005, partial [Solirubrobacteraceae bacterium]|nr:hypothetical protein [Solirubrobacteraceae bacterium]